MDLEPPLRKNHQVSFTDTKMQTETWRHCWKPTEVQQFAHKAVIHTAVVGRLFLEWMDLLVDYHHLLLDFFFSFRVLCSEGLM